MSEKDDDIPVYFNYKAILSSTGVQKCGKHLLDTCPYLAVKSYFSTLIALELSSDFCHKMKTFLRAIINFSYINICSNAF